MKRKSALQPGLRGVRIRRLNTRDSKKRAAILLKARARNELRLGLRELILTDA